MKLYEELPVVLPFYRKLQNQNRFKENAKKLYDYLHITPKGKILPFMLRLPKDTEKPLKMFLVDLNEVKTDISNNIHLLKAVNFEDYLYCYYLGEELIFRYETREENLDLSSNYYLEIEFKDFILYSEIFCFANTENLLEITFSDIKDIEPLRYRKNFEQKIYLDTFLHTSEPEIEAEGERDGDNNLIPLFEKLTIKQKCESLVPDFVKIALHTLEIHDNILVNAQNNRVGAIDRVKVSAQDEETGAYSQVTLSFETDILTKGECENKNALNDNFWI